PAPGALRPPARGAGAAAAVRVRVRQLPRGGARLVAPAAPMARPDRPGARRGSGRLRTRPTPARRLAAGAPLLSKDPHLRSEPVDALPHYRPATTGVDAPPPRILRLLGASGRGLAVPGRRSSPERGPERPREQAEQQQA